MMLLQLICVLASVHLMPRGIVGKEAPSMQDVVWIQTIDNSTATIEKGKVNYLFFFQSWCPGCHSHGFPTLQKLNKTFPNVNFIAVQTVFEGFNTNTKKRAVADVKSFGLNIPVGHDGTPGGPSALMQRYRSGGTPWTVIIDKQGIVRFNGFRLSEQGGAKLIRKLLKEPDYKLLPKNRDGQDLVGSPLRKPIFGKFDAPLTLYRWWTDTCPHCEASLPALNLLREKYQERGLHVVGVYHPKPPSKKVTYEEARTGAKARQFNGEVVIDGDWSQLKKWWLDTGKRSTTSVSILVDNEGIVRFVHPGPVLFPSDQKKFAQENEDYQLLDQAINVLLPPLKKADKVDE